MRDERGFSLVEAMIAIVILAVGLLGTAAYMAYATTAMKNSQEEMIARQSSRELLESMFSARNTQQITFNLIQNVSSGGIFLDGLQPMRTAGPDGIVGTADDGSIQALTLPGTDGLLGTTDDLIMPLGNFQRQIAITPVLRPDGSVNGDVRRVMIRVQYRIGRLLRSYELESYLSRFR